MKIGIDARFAVRQPRRGIGTYSLHLLKELVRQGSQIDFVLYIDRDDADRVLPSAPNVRVHRLWPSAYPLWEQIALPWAAKRDDLNLLHTLGNTAPLWLPPRTKLVLSLMDVMFLQSGEFIPTPTTFYQRAGRAYRACVAPANARRSKAVITISEFSRQDILQLISGLHSNKVIPIHLACDPRFLVENKLTTNFSNRPFLLCLGAEDPRKNTLRIVEAYLAALQNQRINNDLVITGYANWQDSPAYRLVNAVGLNERVKFLPFISIDQLVALYQQATAFLYLSLYEGFGIPILEAFASGCPVIASNTTSIPEVGGDAAIYVDPTNISAIEEILTVICNDTLLQSDLMSKGLERARHFSWAKVANETLNVYQRALSSPQGITV
jgi:glycosyltransferase involved in cell wall biosynthesis